MTGGAPAGERHGWQRSSGTPTTLLLLRHGQTAYSVDKRFSGVGDPQLTEVGRAQAAAAAARLGARGGVDAVVSSPLARARATAAAAAEALGLPVVVDDDLREVDFGDWDGLTMAEIAQRWPDEVAAWLGDPSLPPPGGESLLACGERVAAVPRRLMADHPGQTVLVVSHVTPIKHLIASAVGAGAEALFRIHLDLTGMSQVAFFPDGTATVRLVNDTSHLG